MKLITVRRSQHHTIAVWFTGLVYRLRKTTLRTAECETIYTTADRLDALRVAASEIRKVH
jgi:hypothetical protein